ncbi:MAG: DUF2141 domain-containing protein [Pseudomonadales bacterium]
MTKQPATFIPLIVTVVVFVAGAWFAAALSYKAAAEAAATAEPGAQVAAAPTESVTKTPVARSSVAPNGLNITIRGIRNGVGKVLVLVFSDPTAYADYDVTNAVGYQEIAARVGELHASFPELSGGPYAVSLMHDEDGDYQLGTNGAYPTEGYATSGAKDKYDSPDFKQAAIARAEITLNMSYIK